MSPRWGIAAALVVIVGFAGGVAFALRSSPEGTSATVGRLTLPIPRDFNSYSIPGNTGPGSAVMSHVITNFGLPRNTTIDRVLSHWAAAQSRYVLLRKHNYGPPSDEVLLELSQWYRDNPLYYPRPGPPAPEPVRLHLPLSPDQPWDQERLASGATGYRSGNFRFHHYVYHVLYWVGPDAPASDRAAVLDALHSIRPT